MTGTETPCDRVAGHSISLAAFGIALIAIFGGACSSTSSARHGTPPSNTFEVAQVRTRSSSAAKCHTLPTDLTCLRLGPQIGTGRDVRDAKVVSATFPHRWNVVMRVDASMRDQINRHLGEQLAFIVDGNVWSIVDYEQSVGDNVTIAGGWTDKATARDLAGRLLASRN